MDTGVYGQKRQLIGSEALQRLLEYPTAAKRGIGRDFFESLNLSGKEITPGWRALTQISDDSRSYAMVVEHMKTGLAFATDEEGIIYEGQLKLDLNAVNFVPRAAEMFYSRPVRALSKVLPVLYVFEGGCGGPYPLACECSCQRIAVGGQCTNYGCTACVWCCCPY